MEDSANCITIWSLIGLIVSAFLGAFAALVVDKNRKPKLVFSLNNLPSKSRNLGDTEYSFYTLNVTNIEFKKPYGLITSRKPAANCKIDITYYGAGDVLLYSVKGRWTNSIDPAYRAGDIPIRERYYDLMTISENGGIEEIDLIVARNNDPNAYIWNNESYSHNWINTNYTITPGEYWFNIRVTTQNNIVFSENFSMVVEGVHNEIKISKKPRR